MLFGKNGESLPTGCRHRMGRRILKVRHHIQSLDVVILDRILKAFFTHFPLLLSDGNEANAKKFRRTFESRVDQGIDSDTVTGAKEG